MNELFDKLYSKSEESFYNILNKNLKSNKKMFIVTANPETFMMSENDEEMRKLLLDKDTILVPDGIGIVKAARMINYNVTERIAGIDIANKLLELGNKENKSIYLFGSKQEVIDSMKEVLKDREKLILEMRFGLDGKKPRTQNQIAKVLGISRSYVSRIETKAINKLSKEIEE